MDYSEDESLSTKIKSNLLELVEFVAILAAILIVIRFFIAEPHKVFGSSMFPNFHDKDYIITNKLALRLADPQRGEVVILTNPRNPDQVFIKRVIGLPGETIKIDEGRVWINNNILAEPYLKSDIVTQGEAFLRDGDELIIPQGSYFVIGDNRGASSDSREFGPVKRELLIGQAWLRYWPLNKFGFIKINVASS